MKIPSLDLEWSVSAERPTNWDELVRDLGGGFFHTAGGLAASGVIGEPFFARLRQGSDLAGISAGVRSPCRVTPRPEHVYLPTVPAIPERSVRHAALDGLVRAMASDEAVALTLDSYDAGWQVTRPSVTPVEIAVRQEYIVPLAQPSERMTEHLSAGHRRHVRRGDREGWKVQMVSSKDGQALLAEVQRLAAGRAASRGDAFRAAPEPYGGEGLDPASTAEGSVTFIARHGTTALAAALVGWAVGRGYYVMGGSTPEGYRAAASIWLHWRIMCRLADLGFISYNLGGSSATAASPEDPSHGLYRFKLGFGSSIVPCCSARWDLSPSHQRLHRLGGWLGSAFGL